MSNQLSLQEQAFVQAYTDADNPTTYANGTQSALKAYPKGKSIQGAGVQAHHVLKRPKVQTAIQEIMAEKGATLPDRVGDLRDLSKGGIHKTVHRDGEGKVTATTERDFTPGERTKAIDILNKLAGDYERATEAVKVESDEWKALIKDVFKGVPGPRGGGGEESQGARMESPPRDTTEGK